MVDYGQDGQDFIRMVVKFFWRVPQLRVDHLVRTLEPSNDQGRAVHSGCAQDSIADSIMLLYPVPNRVFAN